MVSNSKKLNITIRLKIQICFQVSVLQYFYCGSTTLLPRCPCQAFFALPGVRIACSNGNGPSMDGQLAQGTSINPVGGIESVVVAIIGSHLALSTVSTASVDCSSPGNDFVGTSKCDLQTSSSWESLRIFIGFIISTFEFRFTIQNCSSLTPKVIQLPDCGVGAFPIEHIPRVWLETTQPESFPHQWQWLLLWPTPGSESDGKPFKTHTCTWKTSSLGRQICIMSVIIFHFRSSPSSNLFSTWPPSLSWTWQLQLPAEQLERPNKAAASGSGLPGPDQGARLQWWPHGLGHTQRRATHQGLHGTETRS